MTDPQIVFQNIDSPTLRSQIKELIEDMSELCPSDSIISCTFEYLHDQFLAEIKVASESVSMHAGESAAALSDTLNRVRTALMGQILDWRIHRFAC